MQATGTALLVPLIMCALLLSVTTTPGCGALRMAMIPLQEMGHMSPMMAIAQEAAAAPDVSSVDVFCANGFCQKYCKRAADQGGAVVSEALSCMNYRANVNLSHVTPEWIEELIAKPPLETFSIIEVEQQRVYAHTAPLLLAAVKKHIRTKLQLEEKTEGNNNVGAKSSEDDDGATAINADVDDSLKSYYDVFLVDVGAEYAIITADVLETPAVVLWPLTTSLPYARSSAVPAMVSSLTAEDIQTSFINRIGNAILQLISVASVAHRQHAFINPQRAQFGLPLVSYDDLYNHRFMITTGLWGVDAGQPLCPNVVPVGLLIPESPRTVPTTSHLLASSSSKLHTNNQDRCGDGTQRLVSVPPPLGPWLDRVNCREYIYWNMGSVAIPNRNWTDAFYDAMAELSTTVPYLCHVWKLPQASQRYITERAGWRANVRLESFDSSAESAATPSSEGHVVSATQRIFVTHHLPFTPRVLLHEADPLPVCSKDSHPTNVGSAHNSAESAETAEPRPTKRLLMFVTHCGDTSVYEAVAATVPLVGIPLFADQPDVCARVIDAGIGRVVSKAEVSAAALRGAVLSVMSRRRQIVRSMDNIRYSTALQGGSKRAADVLRVAARTRGAGGMRSFKCQDALQLTVAAQREWDIMACFGAVICVVLYAAFWMTRRVCGFVWTHVGAGFRRAASEKQKLQ